MKRNMTATVFILADYNVFFYGYCPVRSFSDAELRQLIGASQ